MRRDQGRDRRRPRRSGEGVSSRHAQPSSERTDEYAGEDTPEPEHDPAAARSRPTRTLAPEVLDGDALDSAPGAESGRAISSGEPIAGFYDARITRLSRGLETGEVRTGGGRLVGFAFAFVKMLPAAAQPGDLEIGARVGVDVGWTSRGLRVTTIRIPPGAPADLAEDEPESRPEPESPADPSSESPVD